MIPIEEQIRFLQNGDHKKLRHELSKERFAELSALIQVHSYPLDLRAALRFKFFLEEESAIHLPGYTIPAWRTICSFPDIYEPGEKEALHKGKYIHEQGRVCNLSSEWEGVLKTGLERRRTDNEARNICIDAIIAYADRFGLPGLSKAIRTGAESFTEALQLFRILHFGLWISNVYHNTIGRFDKYMLPYYQKALKDGSTRQELLELMEEFFLSFNRDSDLYTGMQQGDNGQSMMLGGCDELGKDITNDLTELCLEASLNNHFIDPKINLRVNKDTPLSLYRKATKLTKQGLGFPQYANDEVVIPALMILGYTPEDARDYTVAACWEFIIPGKGMDIPNIAAMPLASVVSNCVREKLAVSETYSQFFGFVHDALTKKAGEIEKSVQNLFIEPAPYQSVLMSDFTHDISEGAVYNNYGVHGTGFAEAVDQLAVLKYLVFEGAEPLSRDRLLAALESDFQNDADLFNELRKKAPKLGRDPECEPLADELLEAFGTALMPLRNERGGRFRAGTGSAMYYLWHAEALPALCSGHMPSEKLPANFSPSLNLLDAGPLSVIRAMARPGLRYAMNGGPLTLELHDTVFKHEEGEEKVAALVRTYILLGGHQLQLNAVNREVLVAARERPDEYRGLIVRVWGWSGHFVQLDRAYQDQIIERTSYENV